MNGPLTYSLSCLLALSVACTPAASQAPADPLHPGMVTAAAGSIAAKPSESVLQGILRPVSETVDVHGQNGSGPSSPASTSVYSAKTQEIMSSAGTYGDFSRYLQLLPGVVSASDLTNDILVRGGNPLENLFTVNGIEVPNINHMALSSTTGGLVSMIDTAAISRVELSADGPPVRSPSRLSSQVAIQTRELAPGAGTHGEADFGFVGAGGLLQLPLGPHADWMVSAHRSLLNLFTSDIGLNGVPIYSNLISTLRADPDQHNHVEWLMLGGVDSINIHPCAGDPEQTSTIDTDYGGWRMTQGLSWQKTHSSHTVSQIKISDTESRQSINQQDQFFTNPIAAIDAETCTQQAVPFAATNVYRERTRQGDTVAAYGLDMAMGQLTLSTGALSHITRIRYDVASPEGQQSPYSSDPTRSDATSFAPHLTALNTDGYAEGRWQAGERLLVRGGMRMERLGYNGATNVNPQAGASLALGKHNALSAAFAVYSQQAPWIETLSWASNHSLDPIRSRHFSVGADLWRSERATLTASVYNKTYTHYPVSTEYPTLSLANQVDMLGQQFIWLSLKSLGRGHTAGVELALHSTPFHGLTLQTSLAYARARFSGLDGVMRPGNYDIPLIGNAAATWSPRPHYTVSFRFQATSGRAYTPFNMTESLAQNRPIYNLTQVNAERSPVYSRLDLQADRDFPVGGHTLVVYGGLLNAFNRKNFLGYMWMPHCERNGVDSCVEHGGAATPTYQMGLFPNFGMRYQF